MVQLTSFIVIATAALFGAGGQLQQQRHLPWPRPARETSFHGDGLPTHPIGDYINKTIAHLRANDVGDSDYNTNQFIWSCLGHGDISFKEVCPVGCWGGDFNDGYCIGSGRSRKLAAEAEAARYLKLTNCEGCFIPPYDDPEINIDSEGANDVRMI